MNSDSQRGWALIGARVRLQEIEKERAEILAAFPSLRRGSAGAGPAAVSAPASTSGKAGRKMSAAAKRAMSEGMRKYWARRKAAGK